MDNEMQELIQSMAAKIDRMEKRQKRQRIFSLIVIFCVVAAVIAIAVFVWPKVAAAIESYNALATQIKGIVDQVEDINFDAIKKAVSAMDNIDFEALNEKLAEVGKLTDKISKIDLDGLSTLIDDLLKTLEPLRRFMK